MLATRCAAAIGLATCLALWLVVLPARAGDDELALDLGSASDKPTDAGAGLRKLEFKRIQKGTFVEGSPASDAYREPDEVQRNVTISKTFWMGRYPVTRAQFARFVAETRHQTDAEKGQSGGFGWDGVRLKQDKQYTWRNPGFPQTDDDPVTLVTFGDANAFTAWASRKTGRRVRLPTEAEFELAARGGTTTPWYAARSEEEANALGWYRPQPGQAVGTHPVGKKKANPFGLYDMTGNVNQWCRDVYAVWSSADVTDPENTTNVSSEPERRALRGGSWMRDPRRGRSAARFRNTPGTRNADNGFRLVLEDAPAIAPAPGAASSADLAPSAAPAADTAAPATPVGPNPGIMVQPTPVVQRPPSTEGLPWGFLAAPGAAIGFVVAWILARRKKEATNAQGITTRAGDDGFWVRAPNLKPNSRVRYTCIVKGSEVSDIIPLDGGDETFVFTGGAPTLIHITEAVAVPSHAGGHRSASAPMPAAVPSSVAPSSSVAPPSVAPSSSIVPSSIVPSSIAPSSIAPSSAPGAPLTGPSLPPSVGASSSPWPSDRGSVRSVAAVPSGPPAPAPVPWPSERGLPSGPPAPLAPAPVPWPSERGLPSGPPAPLAPAPVPWPSDRGLPSGPPAPLAPGSSPWPSERGPSGPPAPLGPAPLAPGSSPWPSERGLPSGPPAALPSDRGSARSVGASVPPPVPSGPPAPWPSDRESSRSVTPVVSDPPASLAPVPSDRESSRSVAPLVSGPPAALPSEGGSARSLGASVPPPVPSGPPAPLASDRESSRSVAPLASSPLVPVASERASSRSVAPLVSGPPAPLASERESSRSVAPVVSGPPAAPAAPAPLASEGESSSSATSPAPSGPPPPAQSDPE